MFKLTGVLKKDEIKDYTRKDGTAGQIRNLYIEPEGSIYPIKVNMSDLEAKIGKIGETITLSVEVYAYQFVDKQRKRAFLDVYIPNKK